MNSINNSDLSEDEPIANEDYFGFELTYENTSEGLNNQRFFNGNIGSITWSKATGLITSKKDAYKYDYDPTGRFLSANYATHSNGAWSFPVAFSTDNMSYDNNGNILSLNRHSSTGSPMDELTYEYKGNQLLSVTDNGSEDGANTGDDYAYDANGNMILDKNKGISEIQYNHLNLPVNVVKNDGSRLIITYNQAGQKLSRTTRGPTGTIAKRIDYVGGFIYENDELQLIQHDEGRIVPDPITGTMEYQYHLKDHLGNVRRTFTTKPKNISYKLNYESSASLPDDIALFQETGNIINDNQHDHTDAGTVYRNTQRLKGFDDSRIGSVIALPVGVGDKITAEVYAKYTNPSTSSVGTVSTIASALISAFTGSVIGGNEFVNQTINNSYTNAGSLIGSGANEFEPDTNPKGFLNVIFLPDDETVTIDETRFAFDQVGSVENTYYKLEVPDFIAPDNGYVMIYVSNESPTRVGVFFDVMKVTVTETPIIQMDDYYPFGLAYNSWQRVTSKSNDWKFQGQEHIDDLDLGWDSFKWRNYQPEIGRFFNVDPLTESYVHNSPYAFSENSIINHVELEGLEKYFFMQAMQDIENKIDYVSYHSEKNWDAFWEAVTPDTAPESEIQIKEVTEQQTPEKDGFPRLDGDLDVAIYNPEAEVEIKSNGDNKTVYTSENGQTKVKFEGESTVEKVKDYNTLRIGTEVKTKRRINDGETRLGRVHDRKDGTSLWRKWIKIADFIFRY